MKLEWILFTKERFHEQQLIESNPYSDFLITVMGGVNQLERDLIKMRQKEGIKIAKYKCKYKGILKKYNKNHE